MSNLVPIEGERAADHELPPAVAKAFAARGYTAEQLKVGLKARELRRKIWQGDADQPPEQSSARPLPAPRVIDGVLVAYLHGPREQYPISVRNIQTIVAEEFGVTVKDIKSVWRDKQIILPRHVAVWITRQLTGLSTIQIGKRFGDRDHSTIISALRKIDRLMDSDRDFAKRVSAIKARINGAWEV